MADDDMYEAQAREWLDSVDVPPPRLEVAQIIQTGRGQVRRRRALAAGGTAAALAAVAAIPVAVPLWPAGSESPATVAALPVLDCEVTELPLPADLPALASSESWLTSVVAMDPTGRFILGKAENGPIQSLVTAEEDVTQIESEGGDQRATILWDGGTPTYLAEVSDPQDVNSHGVVLGENAVYRDGAVEPLAVPDGYDSVRARAINEAGDVVGHAVIDDDDDVGLGSAAVVWPGSDLDEPRLLPLAGAEPDPSFVEAVNILDDGTVLGHISYEVGEEGRPYRWDAGGELHALRLPPAAIGGVLGPARGDWVMGAVLVPVPPSDDVPTPSPSGPVSSADAAAAADDIPDYSFRAARWNLRTGSVEVIESVESNGLIFGADISLVGDVIIASGPGGSGETEIPAMAIREGTPYTLPAPEDVVPQPEAISDDGTIIAGSHTTEEPVDLTEQEDPYTVIPRISSSVAVVWHC